MDHWSATTRSCESNKPKTICTNRADRGSKVTGMPLVCKTNYQSGIVYFLAGVGTFSKTHTWEFSSTSGISRFIESQGVDLTEITKPTIKTTTTTTTTTPTTTTTTTKSAQVGRGAK